MTKKKKALAMSVLCAVASVGFVMGASAETMHGNLEEVVIEGSANVPQSQDFNTVFLCALFRE